MATPIVRTHAFRRLRALWRAFESFRDSDAAQTFSRALHANAQPIVDAVWIAGIAAGLGYFVVRWVVTIRWGI